ncbi:hypothetical protein QE152_g40998 [Popillia japonica]|uniref:Uncharacterized protein n=1 Tax=Popillia japonica TaxID=7064 RepID=A0AAW1HEW6_POPJA
MGFSLLLWIESLTLENDNLMSKLKVLERKQKEKNLIIFNIPEVKNENTEEAVKTLFTDTLGVAVRTDDILNSEKGITSRVRGLRLLVNDHKYTLHDISEHLRKSSYSGGAWCHAEQTTDQGT